MSVSVSDTLHRSWRTLQLLLIAALLAGVSGCSSPTASLRNLNHVASFENGSRYTTTGEGGSGSFDVLVLDGDWRQMGRQYGYLLKDRMSELHDKAVAFWIGGGKTYGELQTFADETFPLLPDYTRLLIEGMAETSGMSLEKQKVTCMVMGKILMTILGGCSSMDAWGAYTGGGPLVAGRNWDLIWPSTDYGKFLTVVVYRSPGKNAVADINYAAMFHPQNLMNEKGLFLDYQNGTQSDPRKNPNARYDLFSYMQTANRIEDLDDVFRKISPGEAAIINTADAKAGHVFEWTIDAVRHRYGKNGLIVSTNHFVDPSWTGLQPIQPGEQGAFTLERQTNLLALGEQRKGAINPGVMMQIFDKTIEEGGPTFSGATIYQIVAVPADLTLWFKARGYSGWEKIGLGPLLVR